MRDDYTLADLVEVTSNSRRTLQLWAEAGALQADASTERAGTGVHRRFNGTEAIIACILSAASRLRMSIGALLEVSRALRTVVSEPRIRSAIKTCARGGNTVFVFISLSRMNEDVWVHVLIQDEGDTLEDRMKGLAEALLESGRREVPVVVTIDLADHLQDLT